MDIGTFNKKVLLTGAGFSRNWGGRLAREMWEDVFSHLTVQKRPALRTLLLQGKTFEEALGIVRTDTTQYLDEDGAAMEMAVAEAFARMDDEHSQHLLRAPIGLGSVNKFLARFCPVGLTGYFFTLNQDILIERVFRSGANQSLMVLPGLLYLSGEPRAGLPYLARKATPDPKAQEQDVVRAGCFNYIKLHGSSHWQAGDKTPLMVLGDGKDILIGRYPLLQWYQNLFAAVLHSGNVTLMTIGYGFQDTHINRIIRTGVESHGLRIFVWDTGDPLQILRNAREEDYPPCGHVISNALMGAASRPFSEVFPQDDRVTPENDRIVESFFGS